MHGSDSWRIIETKPLTQGHHPCRTRSGERRQPEATALHRIVREHLETYLALANESDPMGDGQPGHVEKEFRIYLKCRIPKGTGVRLVTSRFFVALEAKSFTRTGDTMVRPEFEGAARELTVELWN